MSNFKLTLGIVLLLLLLVLALGGPLLAQWLFPGQDPLEVGTWPRWQLPSPEHPLGIDEAGAMRWRSSSTPSGRRWLSAWWPG